MATLDVTDFGLKQSLSNDNKDDDGFCVYFYKHDVKSHAKLLVVQLFRCDVMETVRFSLNGCSPFPQLARVLG